MYLGTLRGAEGGRRQRFDGARWWVAGTVCGWRFTASFVTPGRGLDSLDWLLNGLKFEQHTNWYKSYSSVWSCMWRAEGPAKVWDTERTLNLCLPCPFCWHCIIFQKNSCFVRPAPICKAEEKTPLTLAAQSKIAIQASDVTTGGLVHVACDRNWHLQGV